MSKTTLIFLTLLWQLSMHAQIDLSKIILEGKKVQKEYGNGAQIVVEDVDKKILNFLAENGEAILSLAEAEMLKTIKLPTPEKEILSQMIVNLPSELSYKVTKGDEVRIDLKPGKFSKIKRLEIINNEQHLFYETKPNNNYVFQIPFEGKLSLKLRGRKLYKGKTHLLVQRTPSQKEIIAELKRDTTWVTYKKSGMISDTAFVEIINRPFVIRPSIEITSSPFLQIPIEFPEIENYFGFIYWIQLEAIQEPIIDQPEKYVKGEIKSLPKSTNPDLEWAWCNYENLVRFRMGLSFNPYRFNHIKSDPYLNAGIVSGKPSAPLFLAIKNKSNLYEYPLHVLVKAILIERYQGEVEVNEQVINEYIKLSLK
jgi:hypothetical protein